MKKRILLSLVVLVVSTVFLAKNVEAAAGINRRINFQGKVVKTDGTNVADNNYNFQFSLWTTPTVGTSLWTEVWNTGNSQIGVSSGIFSVDLGTNTTFPTSIDFNADTLYLSIGFSGEADMSPRIRMTAVPYAFNAEKVGGLTVTNTTGTLTIPNGKTISFADGFTTVGAGITLDQSLATTNSVSFAGLSIGGTVAFTNLPVGTGTTILYIGAGGSLSAGTLPTGTVYTATNGLNLNANAFGLGGTLTQNTQIGTSSFFLSFIGLGSSVGLSVGPSGYVGIGKSNPGAIFDIDDNASIGTGLRVTGGGSGYNLATFSRDIGGTGKISIHSSGSNPQISFQSAVNTFSIGVSGDNFKISNNAALGTNDYFVLNNSGYVGIGNANPDSLLSIASNLSGGFGAGTQSFSVKNTSGINSATTIGLYPDSGSDFDISIWGSGATPANKAVLIQRNNAPFGIYTNNIERLSINGSGSIGLGTTNPGYKLHVIGDVGVSTALTVGTSASIGSNLTVGGTVSFSGLPVGTGTSIIYLGASGNLLSGTLPAGSVYTATNGLNLNGSAFGLGGTLTQNTRLNIGNTEVLYFQLASGYVGVGTTNPLTKLDVAGASPIIRLTDTQDKTWSFGEVMAGIEFYSSDNSGNLPAVATAIKSIIEGSAYGNSQGLAFYVNNDEANPSERMRLAHNGYLGLGTTLPGTVLDVVGGSGLRLRDVITDSADKVGLIVGGHYTNSEENVTLMSIDSTSDNNILRFGGDTSAIRNAASIVTFFTAANNTTLGGTERMRIDPSGKVGIGTTNPTSLLDVSGATTSTPGPYLTASRYFVNQSGTSPDTFYDQFNYVFTPGTTTTYTGGIYAQSNYAYHGGTGTLTNLFGQKNLAENANTGRIINLIASHNTVANDTSASVWNAYGALYSANNYGVVNNRLAGVYIDTPINTGTINQDIGLYIADQNKGTTNYSIYSEGGNAYFGGNMGIGTTNPTAKLEISGDAAGLTFSGGTSDHVITAVGATLVIGGHKVTGTLDMGNQTIDRVNTLSGYPNQDFLIRSLGTGNLNINANDGQTGKFQWWGGTGTPQVVFTNAGNVGIGTTSPTAKLEITAAGTTNLYGVKSTVSLADGDLYTQNQYAGYFHAANVGTMDSSYGIYAISDATDYNNGSIGVYGEGQTIGLYGYSNGGFGVYGFSSSTGMYANGTNTGLQAIANSATGYGILTWNQNASGYAIYSSQGKNYFAGNVGIGITTPSQKLDVNGSVNIGGSIAIGTIPSVSDNNRILTSSGAGLGILQYINTSAWDKNSANDIAVATNGLRLIGTTAFGLGGTLSQPGFTTINSGTGSSGMAFVVDRLVISATASNYNPDINYNRIKPQAAGTILELTQEDYQEGNNALIYTSNIQNVSSLTFDAGYGPLLFLDGDNGRVGIGTTSPISKFHVVGSSRFEGSTINKGFNAMGDQGTMIPNGGFEINDDAATTIADGWIEDVENSSGTYSFGVGNTAKQGEHSQEIYATTTSQGAVISECIPVTSENTYNLNAVVKGSAATTSTLGLAIKHYANGDCSGASTTLAAVSSGSITTSYTQYGGTVLIPSGQFSARVLVRNNTPSANVTMFVDSVTFSHGASYTIDLAENYYSNTDLLPGQIVGTQDNLISGVTPSTKDNESSLIGVVSTNPAITLGNTLTREGTYLKKIALSGRVPVIVSTKNGTIASGDRITSSSFAPGVGGKAVKSGMTVGTALQSTNSWSTSSCQSIGSISNIVWPDDDGSDTQSRSCYVLPDGTFIGKIMMFVNLSWYDPGLNLTATGEINVNYNISNEVLASLGYPGSKNEIETATYSLTDSVGNAVTKIAQFGKIAVAKINTGFLSANGAVIDNLAAKKIASETIITNDITATNIDTTELIAQNIGASEATFSVVHADLIISPEGNITDVISTKINSLREEFKNMMVGQTLGGGPLLSDLNFENIQLAYQTKLGGITYAVADFKTEKISPLIDSNGNPVEIKIDGNVNISGVLTVDSIKTNSIEGLDVSDQIASLNEKYNQLKSDLLGINSSLSEISVATTGVVSPTPTPEPTNFLTKVLAEFWNKVLFKGQTEFEKNPLFSKDTAGLAILNMGETGVEVKFDNSFETTPIVNISLMADSDEEGQSLSENYVYYVANRNQNGFVIRLNKVARNNIKFSWTALLIKDVKTSQNQVLPTGVVEQTNPVETVTPTITVVPTLEPTAMPTLEPTAMPTLEPTVIPTLEPTPTGVVVQ